MLSALLLIVRDARLDVSSWAIAQAPGQAGGQAGGELGGGVGGGVSAALATSTTTTSASDKRPRTSETVSQNIQ